MASSPKEIKILLVDNHLLTSSDVEELPILKKNQPVNKIWRVMWSIHICLIQNYMSTRVQDK